MSHRGAFSRTFADELEGAHPAGCITAVRWVRETLTRIPNADDNDLWKMCPRVDWLLWLLFDAYKLGDDGSNTSSEFVAFRNSLMEKLGLVSIFDLVGLVSISDLADIAKGADELRMVFPEWPL